MKRLLSNPYLWRTINIAIILSSPFAGYRDMAPDRLAHTNPDKYFCTAILITMPFFVLGALWFATSRCDEFRAPSLDRFPINWWYDPLQALFISTLTTFGWAIGSQLRIAGTGTLGFWTVAFHWCVFVGLLVGQLIGYPLFYRRITRA
jgi:hypothetical protein